MKTLPMYLTIRQAADLLGVSVQRVGQLVKAGKFTTTSRLIGYRRVSHITRWQVKKRLALKGAASPDLRNGQ